MLLNEYYKIQINLSNTHAEAIMNVIVKIFLPTNSKNRVFLTKSSAGAQAKLSSYIQFSVGEMTGNSSTSIEYFIISMIEGNIELKQSLSYEIIDRSESNTAVVSEKDLSPSETTPPTTFSTSEENLDIMVERLENNVVRKRHDDILIVPCVEEFSFESKFYSLDRKPLTNCFENEEFLMRLSLKTKSPFNIDILEAFFIADLNITEKSNFNKNFIKSNISRGNCMENVLTLSPNYTTDNWLTREKMKNVLNTDASTLFVKSKVDTSILRNKTAEIQKIVKDEEDPFSIKRKDIKSLDYNTTNDEKLNINDCLDVLELMPGVDHKKSFINAKINILPGKTAVDQEKKFGLYCIKWRKTNSEIVNESKFLIEGVGKLTRKFKLVS
jgi:trafficking protein particle complex subunit 11